MTPKQIDKPAARALHGRPAGQRGGDWEGKPAAVAKEAYALADAMAAEKVRRDDAAKSEGEG